MVVLSTISPPARIAAAASPGRGTDVMKRAAASSSSPSGQAPRRSRTVVRATGGRVGTKNIPASSSPDESEGLSRRTLLAGKALFTLGEAFIFPWATEGATRPPSAAAADLTPFSPAWLSSILYNETDPALKASGKAALLAGEALQAEGRARPLLAKFEEVYTLAPTEYKMCQRAGLQTAKSYKAMSQKLGDEFDKKANEAKGAVWWWGRGTRWPGWYIIAYLSGRNVWFTAKDDPVGTFTVTEALGLLVPIWLGLLYTLVTYGIPDY